jgi:replicative DNA helicase
MNSADNTDPSEGMLPSSREIEMAVLGAMLLEPQTVGPLVMPRLTDKHFDYAVHQILFREMTTCLREQVLLDIITLTQRLQDKDLLKAIGGPVYLSDLVSLVATITSIEKYIDNIADKGKHDSR